MKDKIKELIIKYLGEEICFEISNCIRLELESKFLLDLILKVINLVFIIVLVFVLIVMIFIVNFLVGVVVVIVIGFVILFIGKDVNFEMWRDMIVVEIY